MNKKIDFDYLQKYNIIYASDEVGRGCLAGDVVTCTVKINNSEKSKKFLEDIQNIIKDSKTLSSKKRIAILELLNIELESIEINKIYSNIFSFIISSKDSIYVDKNNILKSTMDSFKEGFLNINNNLDEKGIWLIDGNKHPKVDFNIENIIKGDSKSILIGIASIIAKEFRDNQMKKIDIKYPMFNFSSHKGYGTKAHYEAIKKHGIIEGLHRKTFLKNIIK